MSSPTIRRSQRSRKPVESIYDKAQRELSQSIESPASNSTRRTITSASTVRSPTRYVIDNVYFVTIISIHFHSCNF